jgi:hypothetical protein
MINQKESIQDTNTRVYLQIYQNYLRLGGKKDFESFEFTLNKFFYYTEDIYIMGHGTTKILPNGQEIEIESRDQAMNIFIDYFTKGDHREGSVIFKAVDEFSAYS